MNKEILLINTGISGVGLIDVNHRIYSIPLSGRLRISEESLKDIVDYPASRLLLLDGHVKVQGAKREMFLDSGLTDEELNILAGEEETLEVVEVTPKPEVLDETTEKVEEESKPAKEEKDAGKEVVAVTYYNWMKNGKYDKIKESMSNSANIATLKGIVEKNEQYNTEEIQKILAEVE